MMLFAGLLMAACEQDATAYGPNEGGLVMRLAGTGTRAVNAADMTLEKCTIRIYERGEGDLRTLIRKYVPGSLPAAIKLLAGDYAVSVQWGEAPDAASFDQCYYEGSTDFSITNGRTTSVEVKCYPQSAVVEVLFTELVSEISDASVELSLHDSAAPVSSLTYTENETGYFTVPEEGAQLDWAFRAQHTEKGDIYKTGNLPIEGGKKYRLSYSYSNDLPGYIKVDVISVDTKTDDHNDVFVFSQDPEVKGDIFSAPQEFAGQSMTVTMEASGDATVKSAGIWLMGALGEQLLWSWPEEEGVSGVTAELSADSQILTVTLNPAFFAFPIGDSNLHFSVTDSYDSKGDKIATISMSEGIYSVETGDYDLWNNSLRLRAMSKSGSTPTFKLRKAGTESWRTVTGAAASGNEFTAAFVSDETDWEQSYNTTAGMNVYRPKTDRCVYANNTYEVVAEIDGHEYRTTFYTACDQSIPNGDMSDSSAECFSLNGSEKSSFWGSGNNQFSPSLCSRGMKSGWYCAHLQSTMAGAFGINMLASGNLFTGTFVRPSTTGTVSFGQDYDWQARPTALHVKIHATIGQVTAQNHKKDGSHPLNMGDPDMGVLYVAIVDWTAPHKVASGTSAPSGMWSPDEADEQSGSGKIIGYGVHIIDKSTDGSELVDLEIPIFYYDKVTKPSNQYKLVISSSANYYGDYMCGCENNELWLTDFSWVY